MPKRRPLNMTASLWVGCNLIVMSSHGRRGVAWMFLGSQTSKVLAYSPVPVLVVK